MYLKVIINKVNFPVCRSTFLSSRDSTIYPRVKKKNPKSFLEWNTME